MRIYCTMKIRELFLVNSCFLLTCNHLRIQNLQNCNRIMKFRIGLYSTVINAHIVHPVSYQREWVSSSTTRQNDDGYITKRTVSCSLTMYHIFRFVIIFQNFSGLDDLLLLNSFFFFPSKILLEDINTVQPEL